MLFCGFCRRGSDRPSFILAPSVDADDSSEVTTTESSSKEGTLESTEDVSKWGGAESRGSVGRVEGLGTFIVGKPGKDVSTVNGVWGWGQVVGGCWKGRGGGA